MPSWLNKNLIRSALTWTSMAYLIASFALGCSDLASGAIFCSASWLDPKYATIVSTAMLLLNQLLKAQQGGVFGAGLVAQTVVVSTSGASGTATPQQVREGPPK
jgi:hypothetical protein